MNEYIDIYCERLGPGLWAEPINLVSNLAFVVAAAYVYPRIRHDIAARLLSVALFAIGIGSAAFHSFATSWSGLVDVGAILIFVLIYLFYAAQRLIAPGPVYGIAAAAGLFPFSIGAIMVLRPMVGDLNGSTSYLPIWILIFGAGFLAPPAIRRGLWIGCAILALSIFFRSIDAAICSGLPMGTHFLWHILNAIMLGWMVIVMAHMAPVAPKRSRG